MAFLLGCEKVSVEYPTKDVFRELSLGVDTGDRIGVVGRNGEGKSTLLGLLAGLVEPDEGRVIRTRGVSVGVLSQRDDLDDSVSVREAILGDMPDYVWMKDGRIKSIIEGLAADVFIQPRLGNLSGGQRRRVDLARLLVGEWDILMLDEPTNHLDLGAIAWLAGYLKTRWRKGEGALLVVTHDRWFLDETCLSMWEVHDHTVSPFEGGFSAYVMQRVERDRRAARAEERRQSQLRRELAWLSRGARARATKPKFHVAAAQALIADVPELRDPLELKRMAMARLGKKVVELEQVSVAFDGNAVLSKLSWIIGPGDRFGIVGNNGSGKTTLLRVIVGALEPDFGKVVVGQTVRFAVLSQHLEGLVAFGNERVRTVIGRYSRRTMLDGKEVTPTQLLERLGFSKADLNEPVADLSGGQKRRLALMLILLDEPNVLVLDEPGNDLDTDMLAAMEDLLDGWPGTLLLVTHDRYLMERVCDHEFALIDGTLRHLPRGIDDYLEIMEERRHEEAELLFQSTTEDVRSSRVTSQRNAYPGDTAETRGDAAAAELESRHGTDAFGESGVGEVPKGTKPPAPSGGEQYRLRKLLASTERKMHTLATRVEALRRKMDEADPLDYETLGALQANLNELEEQRDALEFEWLAAAEALGE